MDRPFADALSAAPIRLVSSPVPLQNITVSKTSPSMRWHFMTRHLARIDVVIPGGAHKIGAIAWETPCAISIAFMP